MTDRIIDPCLFNNDLHQFRKQGIHSRIIELGSHCSNNWQILVFGFKQIMIAFELLTNITDCIQGPPFVELVDCHQVSKVEHIDLFQLSCRSKFRSHHIHRNIRMLSYFCVGLPNSRSFNDD